MRRRSPLLNFYPYDLEAIAPGRDPSAILPDLVRPGTTTREIDAGSRARWFAKRSGFTFIILLNLDDDLLVEGQQRDEIYSASYTRKGHDTSHIIEQQNGLKYKVSFARVGYFRTFAEAASACEATLKEKRK